MVGSTFVFDFRPEGLKCRLDDILNSDHGYDEGLFYVGHLLLLNSDKQIMCL